MRLKTSYSSDEKTIYIVENHEEIMNNMYLKALYLLYKAFLLQLNLRYYEDSKNGRYIPYWPTQYNNIISWFTKTLKSYTKLPPLHCQLYVDILGIFDVTEVDETWLSEWEQRYNNMVSWVLDSTLKIAFNELFLKSSISKTIQFQNDLYSTYLYNPFKEGNVYETKK